MRDPEVAPRRHPPLELSDNPARVVGVVEGMKHAEDDHADRLPEVDELLEFGMIEYGLRLPGPAQRRPPGCGQGGGSAPGVATGTAGRPRGPHRVPADQSNGAPGRVAAAGSRLTTRTGCGGVGAARVGARTRLER